MVHLLFDYPIKSFDWSLERLVVLMLEDSPGTQGIIHLKRIINVNIIHDPC